MTHELMTVPKYAVTILAATVLFLIGSPVYNSFLYGQLSGPMVQLWIDKEHGIKIQFSHLPEKPIADSHTSLQFRIQNLTTGENIHNLSANIVIINDFQVASRFLNVPISNGNLLLNYSFHYNGHNQILVKLKKNSFGLALASFDISVLAPPPSTELLFEAILFGVGFPAGLMVVVLTLLRKNRGNFVFK